MQVQWKNGLALWAVPKSLWKPLPLFLQSWLANGILCYVEYFLSGALWALWVYKCACRLTCARTSWTAGRGTGDVLWLAGGWRVVPYVCQHPRVRSSLCTDPPPPCS